MTDRPLSVKVHVVGLRWQLLGFLAVAGGVALVSIPAGLVVFGVFTFVYGTVLTWIGHQFAKAEHNEEPSPVIEQSIREALVEIRERKRGAS